MNLLSPGNDPLGAAVTDFFSTEISKDIHVFSDIADDDIIPSGYLFRRYAEMPELEKLALEKCQGKILDVGAAAGCHCLELQEMGKSVTALEYSELCCSVMQQRGIKNVCPGNFYSFSANTYDTLLFLMNGIGIAGTIGNLPYFLECAGKLLNKNGRLIFDSSDLIYLFEDDDGSVSIDLNDMYYGELKYRLEFRGISGKEFPWLFIDFSTLAAIAAEKGFRAELVAKGEHYDYLGMLTKK